MQARGFLNYRLKYCWPKVIYCILHMSRVVGWPVLNRPCRYFTANFAEASKRPVFRKSVSEAGIVKIHNVP